MQDSRGNWREIERFEKDGTAIDTSGKPIGNVARRPVVSVGAPVTVILENGTRMTGIVWGFEKSKLTIKTHPVGAAQ